MEKRKLGIQIIKMYVINKKDTLKLNYAEKHNFISI